MLTTETIHQPDSPQENLHPDTKLYEVGNYLGGLPGIVGAEETVMLDLRVQEIVDGMETDHVAKAAPRLSEQVKDPTRTNTITSVPGYNSLGSGASSDEHSTKRDIHTEAEVLAATDSYLKTAIACEAELGSEIAAKARSLRENLTFIGEKEYQEAVAGIAGYWKALLERNPSQQILALSDIGNLGARGRIVKSDEYLLDNILAQFSDEEVKKYKGRLVTDVSEVVAKEDDLRVILLDDWTIGGTQLLGAANRFKENYPELATSLEIQLIAANDERITHGLSDASNNSQLPIPVKAYFRAHEAAPGTSRTGAHITGSHSSVDTDFELIIAKIASQARSADALSPAQHAVLDTMPPIANIVRPYRLPGVELSQKSRFKPQNNPEEHTADKQQYDGDIW